MSWVRTWICRSPSVGELSAREYIQMKVRVTGQPTIGQAPISCLLAPQTMHATPAPPEAISAVELV
jgi:hypothetical protein